MRARLASGEVLLLIAVALWGLNYSAMKYLVTHGFEPLVLTSLRWTSAAVAFCVIAFALEGGLRMSRGDAVRLTVTGLFGIAVTQVANVYSFEYAPAATLSLVFGLLPAVVALVARVAGIERLRPVQWVGVAASCAGVALIALGRGDVGGDLRGILLALVAVVCFSLYSVTLMPIARRTSPVAVNAVSLVAPSIVLTAIAGPQYAGQDWSEPTGLAWAALAFSVLGAIVVGNGLWFVALGKVGPGRAGVIANSQPVFGAAFAVVLLSESLHALELVGAAVIGVGVLLARRRAVEPAPPARPAEGTAG